MDRQVEIAKRSSKWLDEVVARYQAIGQAHCTVLAWRIIWRAIDRAWYDSWVEQGPDDGGW